MRKRLETFVYGRRTPQLLTSHKARETRESGKIAKRRAAMQHNALMELYVDELKDLYDAENRLVKAIPKMAKAASSEKLRSGFEEHFEQTRGHVDRLKQIFDNLGENPSGTKSPAIMAILHEA